MKMTVFTPTYNRAYIIGNLYLSLLKQTFQDFEWLVIDDGSVDETEELFEKWKKENTQVWTRFKIFENFYWFHMMIMDARLIAPHWEELWIKN